MRRRKPKVVWLPATNANTLDTQNSRAGYQRFILNVAGDPGDFATAIIPLVIDGQFDDPTDPAASLADVESTGYRLRRVVGKIWAACRQQAVGAPPTCLLTVGLIVLRTSAITGSQIDANPAHYSPADIDNWDDPWIWRRSWLLTNSRATTAANTIQGSAATAIQSSTNYSQLGGNADGPHVDQKTARIVGSEERLMLVATSMVVDSGGDAQSTNDIDVITDLRVLGSMRLNQGNRRNASR